MSEVDDMAAFTEERLSEEAACAGEVHNKVDCDLGLLREFGECSCGQPTRVHAGVEAKRRIVADCRKYAGGEREFNPDHARYGTPFMSPAANLAFRTLRSLASEYAGHPGYKVKWAA